MRAGYSATGGTPSKGMEDAQAKDAAASDSGSGGSGGSGTSLTNTLLGKSYTLPHETRLGGGGPSPKL